ncbi:MAG: Asp23/Gls24 family envelope stress response protein [Bacillota bacterium]|nr:Asp23/Gls24 family envelope stress response protein [Bacillota bacterium]
MTEINEEVMNSESTEQNEPNETVTTVKIADEVVSIIAAKAAGEVEGIAAMTGTFAGEFVEKLGVKNLSKGIKVEISEANVAISLSVMVNYGYKIPEICKEAQLSVKTAVESMTGLTVTEVNIYVQGITFPQPDEPKEEEEVTEEE